jgi:hypothetical protein
LGKIKTRITLLYDNDDVYSNKLQRGVLQNLYDNKVSNDNHVDIDDCRNKNLLGGNMNEHIRGEVSSPVRGKTNSAPLVMSMTPSPHISSLKNTERVEKASFVSSSSNQPINNNRYPDSISSSLEGMHIHVYICTFNYISTYIIEIYSKYHLKVYTCIYLCM